MNRKLELRQAFFREHTEAGFDGQPKITTAPHDLFEWMWQQCNIANVVERSEQLKCGNKNPPCAPNLKFGMLECCDCNWIAL